MTRNGGAYNMGTVYKITTVGSTYTVLKHLDGSNTGAKPYGGLIRGSDGFLYGLTSTSGLFGGGTLFQLKPATNTFMAIYNFAMGFAPNKPLGSLVQGSDGAFYGMTSLGGTSNAGTIFKYKLDGTFTVLKSLTPASTGSTPRGSLPLRKHLQVQQRCASTQVVRVLPLLLVPLQQTPISPALQAPTQQQPILLTLPMMPSIGNIVGQRQQVRVSATIFL